jgi:hypothetical protein
MNEVTALSAVQDNWKLSRELDLITEQYGDAEKRFVKSEHEYTVEKAKAYLVATGTIAEREAKATIETEVLRIRAKGAEADVRLYRQRLATLRARMENGRSGVSVLKLERELDR